MLLEIDYLRHQPALQLREEDGQKQVYDPVRRKYVALTPEEHVRQLVMLYMLEALAYPKGRLRSEVGITVNDMPRRCDIVVYDLQPEPWLVVECKSPRVQLSQATAEQVARYNLTLRAPYLVITNGLTTFCCRVDIKEKTYIWMDAYPGWEW